RLVLEVLVGEKLLLPRRPHELRTAVHAPENPVLEFHRSLPRPGGLTVRVGPHVLPPPSPPPRRQLGRRPAQGSHALRRVTLARPAWPQMLLQLAPKLLPIPLPRQGLL